MGREKPADGSFQTTKQQIKQLGVIIGARRVGSWIGSFSPATDAGPADPSNGSVVLLSALNQYGPLISVSTR